MCRPTSFLMKKRTTFALPCAGFLTPGFLNIALLFASLFSGLSLWAGNTVPHSWGIAPRGSSFEPYAASFAPPNWTINPANYQFNMNMVFRVRYNGTPNNTPGSVVGAFVGSELRGFASGVLVAGQMYYFVTIHSNVYTGETVTFRTYFAPDDKVYASPETLVFTHHKIGSTLGAPFWVNIDPNADFPPQISPILADTTLQNIPFDPVNLATYLISPDGDPVIWSAQPGLHLTASILNGVLTVTPVSPAWTGTDTVRIIVTENTPNMKSAHFTALFTVLPDYGSPVLAPIPNQTIFPGGAFTPFDLDNYLTFNGPCRKFDLDVFPYMGAVPDPAWPAVPPAANPMSIVARPIFGDEVLAGPGAKLAAFVGSTLLGTATPSGIAPNISYSLSLQNLAAGAITFRFYHAENQYLYEKATTLAFAAGGSVGSVAAPLEVQLSPLVPTLAPNGDVQVSVEDPAWLGTYPVDFIVWDCNFPSARRDTVRVLFSVGADNRPHITTPPTVNFKEGACYALYDAQTTDPQDSEGSGLTYSIAGGADALKFSINPVNGKLSWFGFTPDFETPGDANMDNQYEVLIRVTNSLSLMDELLLKITITDNAVESFQPQVNGGITSLCLVGSAVLQASGGNAYHWNNGDPGTSITVTTPGVYTVTITNDVGCSASISVTVRNRPTITAAGSSTPVCLGTNINLNSSPVGGSGVYTTFAWTGPNSFMSSLEDPLSFPAAPAVVGTYTVTVTDNGGCTATATTAITVSGSSAPAIVAMNDGPKCVGGSALLLTSTPSGGSGTFTTFKWAGPNSYSASVKNPAPISSLSLAAAGVYTVTVTDNAGCTATGTTMVQVNPSPAITATSTSPYCVGANVVLSSTPSGGSGVYSSFNWSGPNFFSSTMEDPANFIAFVTGNGTYTVTVTDNKGCTASGTTTLLINGPPTITAALLGPVCMNGTVRLSSTPAGGSGTYPMYQWSGPNGYTSTTKDPVAFPVTPAVAGTYTVVVTDQAGCAGAGTVSVTINPVPAITAMNNGPVCDGATMSLSSSPSAGTGSYTFQWSGPDGYTATVEDPAAVTTTSASSGIYTIIVTDSKLCTATATTTVVVNSKPTVTATNTGPLCVGANIKLMANPMGGSGVYSTYAWTKTGGVYTSSVKDPVLVNVLQTDAGTYRVVVTDDKGCTASATTNVSVASLTAPTITPMGNSPVCAGNLITLTSSPSGGSNNFSAFQWTAPNGSILSGQNPAAFPATAALGGVYTVKVTDSKGCTGTNTLNITVNAPVAHPSTNSPICQGTTVQLMANPTAGTGIYTGYAWQGPNGYVGAGASPATFVASMSTVGTYTVTVTDNAGCTGTGTVAISFGSNAPPSITCPTTQEVNANSMCMGTLGSWTSLATGVSDDCTAAGNITVTQMPVSGTSISGHDFETIVTLTADDQTGNTTPCTFKVILKDKIAPTITCPPDQTVAADANCAGVVGNRTGLATGLTDNCTLPASISVSQLPIASTALNGHNDQKMVTLTANDGHGNSTPCTFKVTLKDATLPVITCPANIAKFTDLGFCSAVTTYSVTAMDNCTPPVNTLISGLASGDAFPTGVNIVIWKATDVGNNTATCSFTVTVTDNEKPSIVCPLNLVRGTDLNQCNSVVVYALPAYSDNCPGSGITLTSGLPSGATFPKGVNNVNWQVTDLGGNSAVCNFTVTVNDTQAPSITCPSNVVKGTDVGLCSAVVSYPLPTFSDNCPGGSQALQSGGASGSVFLKGTSSVVWRATDAEGLTSQCTFTVTVNDTQAPVITCPASQTQTTALNFCTAIVTYTTPTFTDNCSGGSVSIQSGLPSGSPFPKGINTVVWRATDASNNTKTCTFRITVNDNQAPTISCPPNISTTTNPNLCTALVTYSNATFTDNCTGGTVVKVSGPNSNTPFPRGLNLVVFRATDAAGNTALCTMQVTVTDNQLPTITCPPNISATADPGQCSMVVTYPNPTASDNCTLTGSVLILGLASGSVFPQGATVNTWEATDNSMLTKTCTFSITVACGVSPSDDVEHRDVNKGSSLFASPTTPLDLRLNPNPATTEIAISIEGLDEKGGVLSVFDAQGRLMWQRILDTDTQQWTTQQLRVADFPTGFYRVCLRTASGMVAKSLVVGKL